MYELTSEVHNSHKEKLYSSESEQALLGGLMLSYDSIYDVLEILNADDFYHKEHVLIYKTISRLVLREKVVDKVVDLVTVTAELDAQSGNYEIDMKEYLQDLVENSPGVSNLRAYAGIIRDCAVLRMLVSKAKEIADLVYYSQNRDASILLNQAEKIIFSIAEGRKQKGSPEKIDSISPRVLERINELYKSESSLTGLSSGFVDLDAMTNGLQPSELIIVAGRPSMGKTSFAMNIAENAILREDHKPVLVFSLEMSAESLATRLISSLSRINQQKVSSGRLHGDDWARLTSTLLLLEGRLLFIDDSAQNIHEMRARCRRVARENGGHLGLIIVDYLQLMESRSRADNRTVEISEISRGLKSMAKEFSCPMIALSQLNRNLEQRTNKRPQMADLRESGAIEQDADLILFIYRDEVYNKDEKENDGVADIIIAKQRNGPIGEISLTFLKHLTRFESAAIDY